MSSSIPGRRPIMRPERCPITFTAGSSIAARMRRVLLLAVEVEVRVDRRHAPVEAQAEVLVVIEPALRTDVELGALQEQQVRIALLQLGELQALLHQLLAAHAVDPEVLGVVGDREVLVAAPRRVGDHLFERAAPVAGERRVDVQVAAQILDCDGA